MSKRKTVNIADVVMWGNSQLEKSECAPTGRQGVCNLIETILHNSGVYDGFGYLTQSEVPRGEKPGIERDKDGKATFPDETRRRYYIPRHCK